MVERTIQNSESILATCVLELKIASSYRSDWFHAGGTLINRKSYPISATQAHLLFLYGYNSAVLFNVPILDVYLKPS